MTGRVKSMPQERLSAWSVGEIAFAIVLGSFSLFIVADVLFHFLGWLR
jgi:hypothetical protein